MTLTRDITNPRYFIDDSGNIVYLSGFHNWQLIQDWGDRPDFDFESFIQFMTENNMNLTRSWVWFHTERPSLTVYKPLEPSVYLRTGPGTANDGYEKTDLTKFNEQYFTRLRKRVIDLGNNGIYVAVMLFNGTSFTDPNRWTHNVFNINNNINGIDGDLNDNGIGTEVYDYQKLLSTPELSGVLQIHEAYVKKVIDTLNDLDNVIWDIGNELPLRAEEFINYFIDFVRDYESTKPKQHPVGFTSMALGSTNDSMFASTADWVSPHEISSMEEDYSNDPPVNDGNKVVISDTDHLSNVLLANSPDEYRKWAWKTLTRGHHPLIMDMFPGDTAAWENNPHRQDTVLAGANTCGYIRHYADRIDLKNTIPSQSISSTRYCIYNPGTQYLVYQPHNGQNFNVKLIEGTYYYEMFNPIAGSIVDSGEITVQTTTTKTFINPFTQDAVLYLESITGDPCKGVVCDNLCDGYDLWSQKCDSATGTCVNDQLLETNSVECGYDLCEDVVCSIICDGYDLWSQKCDPATGTCINDQLLESNSGLCGYDPCEGVVCGNICDGFDLWSQKCDPATGTCVNDQLLESNSGLCGYDPCEGVVCGNICDGFDLWSQKCDPATGTCVNDQLLESNSEICGYDPCEGVDCNNICVYELWSQKCDVETGLCELDQLLETDSTICKNTGQIPPDDSTINPYIIIGGLGVTALAIFLAKKR